MVLGLANSGGTISPAWMASIQEAIQSGMDIISGMHQALNNMPELVELATQHAVQLHDIRHPKQSFTTGTGEKRPGKRLLTVGTDCSAGKMYTALAMEQAMRASYDVSFKATGQSGILIAGSGVAIDCVVSDFISGAVEGLSPAADPEHWDIIEGQGSLYHPAFAGVSMGLIHGAQPDALILCHVEGRDSMRGLKNRPLPGLQETIDINLQAARVTNPEVRFIGVSVNTSMLSEEEAIIKCEKYSQTLGLPVVDPLRHGIQPVLDNL
jgi:uncharacterized NAD-dependent epimerase/dehydratase family protein